jgi:hypothetical protein
VYIHTVKKLPQKFNCIFFVSLIGEDLIINSKDFPSIKNRDIVEIYHADDEVSRLLLQVMSFKEELKLIGVLMNSYHI